MRRLVQWRIVEVVSDHRPWTTTIAPILGLRRPREGDFLSLDGRCNYNCVIADVSEGGARVRTGDFGLVPNRVYLSIGNGSEFFDCDVRWRRDGQIGLRFTDIVSSSTRKKLIALCALQPVT